MTAFEQSCKEVNDALASAREICGSNAIIGVTDRNEVFVHDGLSPLTHRVFGWGLVGGFRGVGASWAEALESARLHIAEGTFARLLFPMLPETDEFNKNTPLRPVQ
jgi:hypothetical protein